MVEECLDPGLRRDDRNGRNDGGIPRRREITAKAVIRGRGRDCFVAWLLAMTEGGDDRKCRTLR